MKAGGLSLEQAPPLSIPASFFLTIPIGVVLAGLILMATGIASLSSPWMPQALALAHSGTLGALAMGMIGALYQMTPVVAGSPVPFTRIAHLVHVLMLIGLAGFIWRLLGGPAQAMSIAIWCFSAALLSFVLPLGWALLRTDTKSETVRGMRLAVIALAVITVLGLIMARGFTVGIFPENRMLWVQIHLTLALLGWVGGLIMAVGWQVIPMFYLASTVDEIIMRWFFRLLIIGLILPFASVFADGIPGSSISPGQVAAIGALPAAVVIWLLHPALLLRDISRRKRKRFDASLLFWKAGLGTALLMIPISIAVLVLPEPRWQVLFGWIAIWGWAGMIMHGMLSRIVPFLVWFHRYSSLVGFEPVPSMRSLLPERKIKIGFILHLSSVALGGVAILTQTDWLARAAGVLLVATALSLAHMLVHVLKRN